MLSLAHDFEFRSPRANPRQRGNADVLPEPVAAMLSIVDFPLVLYTPDKSEGVKVPAPTTLSTSSDGQASQVATSLERCMPAFFPSEFFPLVLVSGFKLAQLPLPPPCATAYERTMFPRMSLRIGGSLSVFCDD